MIRRFPAIRLRSLALLGLCLALTGCGKSVQQSGTEQLLTSNAVDRVVAEIDFTPLAYQKVYFDDRYIQDIKGVGFVNSNYIISSLRQQMIAAHCRLQDKADTADYVVEARVGALGNDHHEVSYGIPATNALSSASAVVPTAPPMPAIPEISFAKKEHQLGAAKIGVFAYDRQTKEPVWQAGVKSNRSRSRSSWLLGIGPVQTGTIYEGPMFAGVRIKRPVYDWVTGKSKETPAVAPPINYRNSHMFPLAQKLEDERKLRAIESQNGTLEWANHEEQTNQINNLVEQASQLKATDDSAPKEVAKPKK
ncbi:DUF6655 family protein [Rubinisphaera margarita]|uniref:DUF6655 family protein n=1 Tax=Rubinisphaera margarita TaxID=2909586 RepID=UPI001EE82D55|nr:DUF6655 family protein [Rubinisphaera margarita]MCG6157538.1 hypothetical protein [Rubinisphaera margarita]